MPATMQNNIVQDWLDKYESGEAQAKEPDLLSEDISAQDQIETALGRMFTENTGRHMLDSGGHYGRNWERNNQTAKWKTYPAVYLTDWMGVAHKPYFWLLEWCELEYEPVMTEALWHWAVENSKTRAWIRDMETWAKMHTDDPDHIWSHNTYGSESLPLTQDLQWVEYHCPEDMEGYLLLQVHGGCDARGGYTKPRVFRMHERIHPATTYRLNDGDHEWSTDCGGAYWYPGPYGGVQLDLSEVDVVEIDTMSEQVEKEYGVFVSPENKRRILNALPSEIAEDVVEIAELEDFVYKRAKKERAYAEEHGMARQHYTEMMKIDQRLFDLRKRVGYQMDVIVSDSERNRLYSPLNGQPLELGSL